MFTVCGSFDELCGQRAQQVQDLGNSGFIPGTLGRAEAGTATILDT